MRLIFRRYSPFRKSNYKKSNDIVDIDFYISRDAKKSLAELLDICETNGRQFLAQKLVNELNKLAEIPEVKIKISEAVQRSKRRNGRLVFKQYGYYRPASKYIYINNRTAVQAKLLAPKTFIDTLLHEWMHHYDHEKLGLQSIHTSGFYARLKDVKGKLGFWDENKS